MFLIKLCGRYPITFTGLMNCTLEDVLAFFSGSSSIPTLSFLVKLKLNFYMKIHTYQVHPRVM